MVYWLEQEGQRQDMVLASRVRLARNYEDLFFSPMMDEKQAQQSKAYAIDGFKRAAGSDADVLPMDAVAPLEKEALIEQHLISRELADRPQGALLLGYDRRLSVMVNEEDHLRMQCILPGLDLKNALDSAMELDTRMEQSATYAFDDALGYLTACPTNVGTGLRASVMMHLPALTYAGHMGQTIRNANKFGMEVRGAYGEGSKANGCVYQLSNQITLGASESELVDTVLTSARRIMDNEQRLRDSLLGAGNRLQVEDRLYRAWGTLCYARKMNSEEFMQLWSDVKLAVGLGLIDRISHAQLHRMMIEAQPACLQKRAGKALSPGERDALRAEVVRSALEASRASA